MVSRWSTPRSQSLYSNRTTFGFSSGRYSYIRRRNEIGPELMYPRFNVFDHDART